MKHETTYLRGARSFVAGRFETVARAGHSPHLEQPDEFARRIFAFVDGTA